MFERHRPVLLSLVVLAVSSCATFPPPEERQPEADPDLLAEDEPDTTAEWLFVTSEGERAADPKAKCDKVARWLEGEKECAGEICIHARDLGREWLKKCEKSSADRVALMQDLVGRYEERADLPADTCITDGTGLLRTQECGAPDVCEKQTQRWIARCGPRYATPLFIVMLTRTLQRRFPDDPNSPPHEVEFDPRPCEVLADVVGNAVGCDGAEPCRLSLEAADAWMDRCYSEDAKVPVLLAFRIADVRVGAGKGVDPIPVNPLERKLADGAFKLQLDDNRGVVAWACGERPKDVADYLRVRSGCKPGELVITRLDATNHVRAVSIPHADDEEFQRLFGFLRVDGERDARELAGIEGFRRSIAEAVAAASERRAERAIPILTRALIPRAWTVARQTAFQKVLTDADGALAPVFKAWGKLKVKQSFRIRGRDDQAMFSGRAVQSPLHDMSVDGSVVPEAFAAPWPLTLNAWMPVSFAAYQDEIAPLARAADRNRPSDDRVSQLISRVGAEIRACAEAEKQIASANDEVVACMSAEGACTQDKLVALASKADPDRRRAESARNTILRILTSGLISRSDIDRLESERLSSGCLDP